MQLLAPRGYVLSFTNFSYIQWIIEFQDGMVPLSIEAVERRRGCVSDCRWMVLPALVWWINFSRMARRMFEDLGILFAGKPRQGTRKYIGSVKTIVGVDTPRDWVAETAHTSGG